MYDYVPGKAAWMAMDLPVEGDTGPETRAGAVAERDAPTCGLDDTVADVARLVAASAAELCVVVEGGLVMGVLEGDALADGSRTAAEAMRPGPSTFRPSTSKEELAGYLDEHDLDHTLITTLDGRLIGIVRRANLGCPPPA
ncbi:MAG: CBS domain-containing protein [Acidimicrobiales bacterium]